MISSSVLFRLTFKAQIDEAPPLLTNTIIVTGHRYRYVTLVLVGE